MPRMPYADPAAISDYARQAIEQSNLNVMRMLAGASEPILRGFNQVSGAFYMGSDFPADLREVAILRVGVLTGAQYEVYHHETGARAAGFSDEQIEAIKQGGEQPRLLTPAQQAVLSFTDEVVKDVRASDAALAGVRRHLSDRLTLDLLLLIGAYMTIARVIETTGVEMEGAPHDWSEIPAQA